MSQFKKQPPLTQKKQLLLEKINQDTLSVDKFRQSIKTHKTLIEVVEENRTRFDNPDDMIKQFTAIIERFEGQMQLILDDIRRSGNLVKFIDEKDEHTVEEVLTVLLST